MIAGTERNGIADGIELAPHDFGELVGHDAKEVERAGGDAVGPVIVESGGVAEGGGAVIGGAVVGNQPSAICSARVIVQVWVVPGGSTIGSVPGRLATAVASLADVLSVVNAPVICANV